MQGMAMLFKKQLLTYCIKDFRNAKLDHLATYKQFLELYFQHFIEEEYVVDSLPYFSEIAKSQFLQVIKHKPGTVSIKIENVQIQKNYLQQLTRVYICFPDTPFIIESIRAALSNLGCHILQNNLVANYSLVETKTKRLFEACETGGDTYAWLDIEMHEEVSNQALKKAILDVISDVECCVKDWRRMQDSLRNVIYSWRDTPECVASSERVQSYIAFMEWILKSFTFLGYHGYRLKQGKRIALGDKWGLSAQKGAIQYSVCHSEEMRFPEQTIGELYPLILMTQTEDLSTVHRNTYKDMIVLRVYAPGDKPVLLEEHYFTGLLTADAYGSDPSKIPMINQKYDEVLALPGVRSRYSLRRMRYIFKSLPREEIFQADIQTLAKTVYDILMLQERRIVKVCIRRDVCRRFYSVMVFVPRNIFTTRIRIKIENYLQHALQGRDVQYTPFFAESVLTRLHFIFRCDADSEQQVSTKDIQAYLTSVCESWDDNVYGLLCGYMGQREGFNIAKKYIAALSDQYRNTYNAKIAATDIISLDGLNLDKPVDARIQKGGSKNVLSCRLYQVVEDSPIALVTVFPILSNFGFDVLSEQHFEELIDDVRYNISEYRCKIKYSTKIDIAEIETQLVQSITGIITGEEIDDGFNALLVLAGLNIREVEVIRAMCSYLHQIKFPLTMQRVSDFFVNYPGFAQSLIKLFNVKFQPKIAKRDALIKRYVKEASKYADVVKTSDDERIIQSLLSILNAIVRTNYCLTDQSALVFKINSSQIMDIPKPAPLYEFFVYSGQVMGVHLRFSRTARGGIRNSDRIDDVRHEVFELAKTQRLKNTLIVPDGAKGGFVCKQLHMYDNPSEEILKCYKVFIQTMLSIVDNYVGGKIIRPSSMVIYDQDDAYFVVAADKGTATFSPYANAISLANNYWLGDAFASGGKHGYDHKKMGITAKGAWESVKWHFMSLNRNVYQEEFTVSAIGDMSGDVFGNGMLLSDKIRLVAAFSYADIFIDPNPDAKNSYQERLRLFQLPKSSWHDYQKTLISSGGGVFSRQEKYIELSSEMKKLFSTTKSKMEPSEIIKEILKLPVDLLWNGGIGVYVKASSQTHFDVMDFHNDAYRIDANELKAKVVGEGGNNGFTQLARVEYAAAGGMINTDFIDNSAGVNTSDVEVNYKILFQSMLGKHGFSLQKRNSLLSKLTHLVSETVLHNNFLQNVQIDLALAESKYKADHYIRMIDRMESLGLLDRKIEFLPTKRELQNRKNMNAVLTRPELAVVLSYCKIELYAGLSRLKISHDTLTHGFLKQYFPAILTKKYGAYIDRYMLKNELITTELTNNVISEAGLLFVSQLADECDTSLDSIITAYLVVRKVLGLGDIYNTLYKHASSCNKGTLLYLIGSIQRSIYKSCRWLIRYRDLSKPDKLIKEFSGMKHGSGLIAYLPKKYVHRMLKTANELQDTSMLQSEIDLICEARYFYQLFGLHAVSSIVKCRHSSTIQVYYQIAHLLKFHKVKERLTDLRSTSRWEAIQRASIDDDLGRVLELLTRTVILYAEKQKVDPASSFEIWSKAHQDSYINIKRSFNEILELRKVDYSVFVVILSRIQEVLEL